MRRSYDPDEKEFLQKAVIDDNMQVFDTTLGRTQAPGDR